MYESIQNFDYELVSQYVLGLISFLPELIFQEWDGSEWVNFMRMTSEFNYEGETVVSVVSITETWEEGEWLTTSRMTCLYEQVAGKPRPSLYTVEIGLDEDWITMTEMSFAYEGGNLVEVTVRQNDFFHGLQNAQQILFEYDEMGSVDVEDDVLPQRYALDPAYPNPFNPSTNLTYKMSEPGHVTIRVYDALGRTVATLYSGVQAAGEHRVTFDAAGLPSGLYVVRMEAEGFQQARLATLIK